MRKVSFLCNRCGLLFAFVPATQSEGPIIIVTSKQNLHNDMVIIFVQESSVGALRVADD